MNMLTGLWLPRFILLFLLLPNVSTAQTSYNRWEAQPAAPITTPPRITVAAKATSSTPTPAIKDTLPASGPKITIQQMPEFPGGNAAFSNYIRKNLKRPKGPKLNGSVRVTFMVLATGAVTNAHILPGEGLGAAYDEAALELVRKLPPFSPGKINGTPSNIEVRYPIKFD